MKLSRTACYAIHAVVFMASQSNNQIVIGHRAVLHGVRIGRDSLIGMGAMLL